MSANRTMVDEALEGSLELQAVATWMLHNYLSTLSELERELQAQIIIANIGSGANEASRRYALDGLLQRLKERIAVVLLEIESRFENEVTLVADAESERQRRAGMLAFGVLLTPLINNRQIVRQPISGVTIKESFDRLVIDMQFRLMASLRRGVDLGETGAQLAGRITSPTASEPPVFAASERSLDAIVRTQIQGVAQSARINSTVVTGGSVIQQGWQHLSVLDSRTSQICWSRAFLRWDREMNPVGHDVPFAEPPLHVYCRSRLVMIDLGGDQVGNFTLAGWLNRIGESRIRRLFGQQKTQLWKLGKISETDLLRSRNGITLDEFTERAKNWQP